MFKNSIGWAVAELVDLADVVYDIKYYTHPKSSYTEQVCIYFIINLF